MKTKVYIVFLISFLLTLSVQGQNLVERKIFNSFGQSDIFGNIELLSSVGEVVIGSGTYANIGFIQPEDTLLYTVTFIIDQNPGSVSFFPNPAANDIQFISSVLIREITIINYLGQEIQRIHVSKKESTINIDKIATGLYYFVCYNQENAIVSTIKIVKI